MIGTDSETAEVTCTGRGPWGPPAPGGGPEDLHPLSKYIEDNAAKRLAITRSLRGAIFGNVSTRSGEVVMEKEVKRIS